MPKCGFAGIVAPDDAVFGARIATPSEAPAGLTGARERVRELAAARGLGALRGTAG